MHPSLIKEFINLITNGNLDYLRFQVIMTTHNPVTVNFINLANLFELKLNDRNQHEIVPVEKKYNKFCLFLFITNLKPYYRSNL